MTPRQSQQLWAGFEEPVHQSQQAFKAILKAMSEPGVIVGLDGPEPMGDLCPAAWATLLTLTDNDTAVWISPGLAHRGVEDNLRFHCGVPISTESDLADFAVLTLDEWSCLDGFATGNHETPHQTTTLIVQVPALDEGHAYQLSGPGIQDCRPVHVSGLTDDHLRLFENNRQRFPTGLDIVLVSADQLLGLPRTTRIQLLEEEH
ncbi:phosphonate C-P lyase system protein PhnH [Marinobacter fonticola]|uniref:phosphonate C-P lyase system protein PhnH n=1 Tax=Marinobacter fonticola TaxID=2603215 RepID=UPI0011E64C52|nr:phosphonate C-P lyase system protein PhnH [Marinobacter fonticola]